jgi:hypothetical protein
MASQGRSLLVEQVAYLVKKLGEGVPGNLSIKD